MAVLLERLAWQEMLQEFHIGVPQIRTHVEFVALPRGLPQSVQALRRRLAECFGIRIAAIDVRILVGIFTQDESSSLLVEIGCSQREREPAIVLLPAVLCVQLRLLVARVVSKATVVGMHD